jgi:hypothetical protein
MQNVPFWKTRTREEIRIEFKQGYFFASRRVSTRRFQQVSFSTAGIEFPVLLRTEFARNLRPVVLMCTGISLRKQCAFTMREENLMRFWSYHTLASECAQHPCSSAGVALPTMTKREVLSIFDHAGGFLTPDQVRTKLQPPQDRRSVYSYLLRLHRQGLLERKQTHRGTLAYRLTERGRARLEYLNLQGR